MEAVQGHGGASFLLGRGDGVLVKNGELRAGRVAAVEGEIGADQKGLRDLTSFPKCAPNSSASAGCSHTAETCARGPCALVQLARRRGFTVSCPRDIVVDRLP